jgi:hypothetical protein
MDEYLNRWMDGELILNNNDDDDEKKSSTYLSQISSPHHP